MSNFVFIKFRWWSVFGGRGRNEAFDYTGGPIMILPHKIAKEFKGPSGAGIRFLRNKYTNISFLTYDVLQQEGTGDVKILY